jgi:cytochrome c oxidase subunit 3
MDTHTRTNTPPQLQHHFDTPEQQFESGKFGMWLFLATEILLFGGLFCAYAVYRAHHPEIFIYAHKYLDTSLGALNTAVLIFSSLTMAWAVRAAQLSQTRLMLILLSITILCGFTFMGVKYVEYKSKWEHGLLWGTNFDYNYVLHGGEHHGAEEDAISDPEHTEAESQVLPAEELPLQQDLVENPSQIDPSTEALRNEYVPATSADERSSLPEAAMGPIGLVDPDTGEMSHATIEDVPGNVHIFFGIYFVMTGLHGIHVILGMCGIGWLIFKGSQGVFSSEYYTPVDLVGLYWHLVDLIWIYLFPLLYLIH